MTNDTEKEKTTKILKAYANDLYLASDELGLTDWEKDFVFDMVNKVGYFPKQAEKLLQLAEKYDI